MTALKDNLVFVGPRIPRVDNMVDLFAGSGGSGGGLLDACDIAGRDVRGTFVNHWDKAIEVHELNNPGHRHLREDLFLLDPADVFEKDTYCSLLFGSPACTFFSIARGGACVNEQDRSHANSMTDWVKWLRPEGILVENVESFRQWCRVEQVRDENGELRWAVGAKQVGTERTPFPKGHERQRGETEEEWSSRLLALKYSRFELPVKKYKGEYFKAWRAEIEALGYISDYRILGSADYGDPTIRKRLFVYFARKDSGKKIVWPSPTHAKPGKDKSVPAGCYRWQTTRDIVDWTLKGRSVFARKKDLARNTMRRLAIGLVKYGLREFLLPSNKGWTDGNVRSCDEPTATLTSKSRAEGLVEPVAYVLPKDQGWDKSSTRSADDPCSVVTTVHRGEMLVEPVLDGFLVPNFSEKEGQAPRSSSLDAPVPAVTSHGAGGLVVPDVYVASSAHGNAFPADDDCRVKSADTPLPAQCTSRSEGLAQPSVIQLKGKSTAQDIDAPLTAITAQQSHYVLQPTVDHLRGTGRAVSVDQPTRSVCAGGQHQALAEAFAVTIDQTGGAKGNHGTYSADDPVHTIVTKANQACVRVELVELQTTFMAECQARGVNTGRAETFLGFLMEELHKKGRIDAKPWIYVYHSQGSEGSAIDDPLPTVSTKKGTAICYPVLELDGKMLKIDLFYRMLTTLELQRAMGFPDEMEWGDLTQEERVKAIGNSVSRGVARALGLAWYLQDPDVGKYMEFSESGKYIGGRRKRL